MKNGMVFTKPISDTTTCSVFIVISDNKILKFTSEDDYQVIIDNVRRLKLGVSKAPSFSLCSELPKDALVSSTGALSPASLRELIMRNKLDDEDDESEVHI